jgi:hypothetical protein
VQRDNGLRHLAVRNSRNTAVRSAKNRDTRIVHSVKERKHGSSLLTTAKYGLINIDIGPDRTDGDSCVDVGSSRIKGLDGTHRQSYVAVFILT